MVLLCKATPILAFTAIEAAAELSTLDVPMGLWMKGGAKIYLRAPRRRRFRNTPESLPLFELTQMSGNIDVIVIDTPEPTERNSASGGTGYNLSPNHVYHITGALSVGSDNFHVWLDCLESGFAWHFGLFWHVMPLLGHRGPGG
jgi:hypothetical protein